MCKLAPPYPPSNNWYENVRVELRDFFNHALEDYEFLQCKSFRDQCSYFFTHGPGVPLNQIALFFGINSKDIWNQKRKLEKEIKPIGRPSIINHQQASEVINFINGRFQNRIPATINDVLNFVWDKYQIDIIPDTLRKWINRSTAFKTVDGKPIEEERLKVSIQKISNYFDISEEAIKGVPSALVFNLDESGFQKFADARNNTIIIPKNSDLKFYPISRNEKRATFLAAVAADGHAIKPLLILARKNVELELFLAGYTDDQAVFAYNENGFITTDIFERYLVEVFIPYVNVRRSQLNYYGKAVLTMDNCSCHTSDNIMLILEQHGIQVIFLPPHSSDQTQVCDLGLFGNMKGAQSRIHPSKEMSIQTQQIIRIISAYHACCHPFAITSAFRRAGISNYLNNGVLYSKVTRWTCTSVRNMPEEWNEERKTFKNFEKKRIYIGDGLWGRRADHLLTEMGIETFDYRLEDLENIPDGLEQIEEKTKLSSIIEELWNGEIPEEDESDDADFVLDESDDEESEETTNYYRQPKRKAKGKQTMEKRIDELQQMMLSMKNLITTNEQTLPSYMSIGNNPYNFNQQHAQNPYQIYQQPVGTNIYRVIPSNSSNSQISMNRNFGMFQVNIGTGNEI